MAKDPALTPEEPLRLQALRDLNIVDTPLEERFERITRLAKRLFNVEMVAISLVESDRQFFKSVQGLDCVGTPREHSFCGHSILDDDLFIVPDAREDERFFDNPYVTGPPGIVFYAAMPIRSADGQNIGALCVLDRKPREFGPADQQAMRDLAALAESEMRSAAANALQAELLENLDSQHRRSMVDSVTRMWNREGITQMAQQAATAAAMGDHGAALLMIDLDHFKAVNDQFGHAAGDEVLRSVARRMLSVLRDCDAVGRYGGDEFLIVVSPCAGVEAAYQIAERIREKLTLAPIMVDSHAICARISLGIHYIAPGCREDYQSLVAKADQALYAAKHAGRNCVRGSSESEALAFPA